MDSPVSAISYLARAEELLKSPRREEHIYSALELRCGVEARLKEYATAAAGVSKTQLGQYEIRKLSKTVRNAFGLNDSFLLVFLQLIDGRQAQFTYSPVTRELQDIATKLGRYLHAVSHDEASSDTFWLTLRKMLTEGCALLKLACHSEILRPTLEHGLHFNLPPEDPRIEIIKAYQSGVEGALSTFTLTPQGKMTIYPSR